MKTQNVHTKCAHQCATNSFIFFCYLLIFFCHNNSVFVIASIDLHFFLHIFEQTYIDIKPFYMRSNDDGKTVAAFDILFPGVGEIVGGSGREERLDYLENAMQKKAVNGLDWYVDLRRHGTVPHAGFGIGFERLLMSCTGVKNVRDCIPFPRTPGSCPA